MSDGGVRYYYPQSISRNENCAFEKICSKKAGISLTFHLCINANEKAGLSKICVFAGYSFGWFECSFGKNKRRRKKGNGFDDLFILAVCHTRRSSWSPGPREPRKKINGMDCMHGGMRWMMMKLVHIKIMHICVFKLYIIGFEWSTMWPTVEANLNRM